MPTQIWLYGAPQLLRRIVRFCGKTRKVQQTLCASMVLTLILHLMYFCFSSYQRKIAGNLMTILVIFNNNLDLKTSFLHLIYLLSIFDCLCIVCNIFIFSGPLLSEKYRHQVIVCNIFIFIGPLLSQNYRHQVIVCNI